MNNERDNIDDEYCVVKEKIGDFVEHLRRDHGPTMVGSAFISSGIFIILSTFYKHDREMGNLIIEESINHAQTAFIEAYEKKEKAKDD